MKVKRSTGSITSLYFPKSGEKFPAVSCIQQVKRYTALPYLVVGWTTLFKYENLISFTLAAPKL